MTTIQLKKCRVANKRRRMSTTKGPSVSKLFKLTFDLPDAN